MTNLKSVNIGQNKFCGPAVLSILTGKNTDECARAISKVNGSYNVTGVLLTDLIKAADNLGFNSEPVMSTLYRTSLYGSLVQLVNKDGMYIFTLPKHFICIEVKDKQIHFCDNHTKSPIRAASSARLGQTVVAIHKVTKKPELSKPKIEPVQEMYETVHFIRCVYCGATSGKKELVEHFDSCQYEIARKANE